MLMLVFWVVRLWTYLSVHMFYHQNNQTDCNIIQFVLTNIKFISVHAGPISRETQIKYYIDFSKRALHTK